MTTDALAGGTRDGTTADARHQPGRGAGLVEAIHIAPSEGAPMRGVARVRAVARVGLEGDRYAIRTGHWSEDPKADRDITLIEAEVVDELAANDGIHLRPGESRRNVLTRGIRLNDLVGRRFRVGDAVCEGTRLCEPCQYLTDLVGKPILQPLVHRGGLRARVVETGEIAVGALVMPLD